MRCNTLGGCDTVGGCDTACDFLRFDTAGDFLLCGTADGCDIVCAATILLALAAAILLAQ